MLADIKCCAETHLDLVSFGLALGSGAALMAFFEDLAKGEILSGNVLTGLAIGAAAVILAPLGAPLLRPIAKAVIKGGIYAYDGAVAAYNQAASGVNELSSEAQQELQATTPASTPHRGRATTETG
jgi:hypothetical protein